MTTAPKKEPRKRRWVPPSALVDLWRAPADPTLAKDLEKLGGEIVDPWVPTE